MRTIATAITAGRIVRGPNKRPMIELDPETLGNLREERRRSLAAKGAVGPVTTRDRLVRAKLRAAAQRVGPGVATAAGL